MNIFWVSAMAPGTVLSTGTTKVSKKNEVRVPTALLSKANDHINRGSEHNSRDWWMPEKNKNRMKSQSLRKSPWKWHLMWDLNDKRHQPCRDLGTEHITQKDSKGKGLRLQTRGMPDSHKALRAGAEWAWAGAGQVPAQRGQSLHCVPAAGGATEEGFRQRSEGLKSMKITLAAGRKRTVHSKGRCRETYVQLFTKKNFF